MPTLMMFPIKNGMEKHDAQENRDDAKGEKIKAINLKVSSIVRDHYGDRPIPRFEMNKQEHDRVESLLKRLKISSSCPRPRSSEQICGMIDASSSTKTNIICTHRESSRNSSDDSSVTTLGNNNDSTMLDDTTMENEESIAIVPGSNESPSNRGLDTLNQSSRTTLNDTTMTDQSSILLLSPANSGTAYALAYGSPDETFPPPDNDSRFNDSKDMDSPIAKPSPSNSESVTPKKANRSTISEASMGLLPADNGDSPVDQTVKSQSRHRRPENRHYQSDDSSMSMEAPRRRDVFDSPASSNISRNKRQASTSGKKGMDHSRLRTDGCSPGHCSFVSSSEDIDSPPSLSLTPSLSVECGSSEHEQPKLFSASQSPIVPYGDDEYGDLSSDDSTTHGRRNRHTSNVLRDRYNRSNADETVETVDCTILQRRKVRWNVGTNDSYHDEPNIQLRDGAIFRKEPLHVRRQRPYRSMAALSFPDPLSGYQGHVMERLNKIHQWMFDREGAWDDAHKSGVIVSLSTKQIMNVSMKLLLSTKRKKRTAKREASSQSQQQASEEPISGGTLIVVRDKEDLQLWQSALREGTAHSVFDFTTLTPKERQRKSAGHACAGFDIVLSTFDALKSKDLAVALDSSGHAVSQKLGYQDGWYSSRNSQDSGTAHYEPLTVMHHITWDRILLVDVFGRKSYMSKPGTARVKASVALNGSPRFIFFVRQEGDRHPLRELASHDQKAMRAIPAVLRLPPKESEEETILDYIVGHEDL